MAIQRWRWGAGGVWLDEDRPGLLNIETNIVSAEVDLTSLAGNVAVFEGGGLGRRLSAYRLPEIDWSRRATLDHTVSRRGSSICHCIMPRVRLTDISTSKLPQSQSPYHLMGRRCRGRVGARNRSAGSPNISPASKDRCAERASIGTAACAAGAHDPVFLGAQTRMIAGSPLEDLDRPNEPVDRDRLLSDKELVAIYGAAQKVGYPFGHIIHTHCDAARGSRRTLLLN